MSNNSWSKLSSGRTIGKRINIPVQPTDDGVSRGSSLNMFQVQGDDSDALPLLVNLNPPLIIPASQFPGGLVPLHGAALGATGSRYNDDIYLHTPTPLPAGGYSYGVQAVAIIEWGIGGVQSKAEVDFINGACININASWVRIGAFIDQTLNDFTTVDGGVWDIGAFVGPGFPRSPNAQRTYNVGAILPADVNFPFPVKSFRGVPFVPPIVVAAEPGWPVPFYAKQAWVMAARSTTAPLSSTEVNDLNANITFYRDTRMNLPLGTFRITNDNPGPVPVPNGAFYWTVQSNILTGWFDVNVVFDLNI